MSKMPAFALESDASGDLAWADSEVLSVVICPTISRRRPIMVPGTLPPNFAASACMGIKIKMHAVTVKIVACM